jgi:hypothetical protein
MPEPTRIPYKITFFTGAAIVIANQGYCTKKGDFAKFCTFVR